MPTSKQNRLLVIAYLPVLSRRLDFLLESELNHREGLSLRYWVTLWGRKMEFEARLSDIEDNLIKICEERGRFRKSCRKAKARSNVHWIPIQDSGLIRRVVMQEKSMTRETKSKKKNKDKKGYKK